MRTDPALPVQPEGEIGDGEAFEVHPTRAVESPRRIVLDTNIVLDLLVFCDPATQLLTQSLRLGTLHWIATAPMRGELERVLAYPQIARCLAGHETTAAKVLDQFDAGARLTEAPGKASVTCKDQDDQKFIDLAVMHQAQLLSKDKAILCMRKRLLALGVCAQPAMLLLAK